MWEGNLLHLVVYIGRKKSVLPLEEHPCCDNRVVGDLLYIMLIVAHTYAPKHILNEIRSVWRSILWFKQLMFES